MRMVTAKLLSTSSNRPENKITFITEGQSTSSKLSKWELIGQNISKLCSVKTRTYPLITAVFGQHEELCPERLWMAEAFSPVKILYALWTASHWCMACAPVQMSPPGHLFWDNIWASWRHKDSSIISGPLAQPLLTNAQSWLQLHPGTTQQDENTVLDITI